MKTSLPAAPFEWSQGWGRQLVDDLEVELIDLSQPIQIGYTTTNVTTVRALDADATTLAEVADVLCTLIEDLKAKGRLG